MKLNLGAGNRPLSGYINHDVVKLDGIDKVFDLNVFPYPIEDNSFQEVKMWNVLEHLNDTIRVIEEVYRILELNGEAVINVPFWNCWEYAADPTHKRPFHWRTMNFFDITTPDGRDRSYYSNARFNVTEVAYWIPLLHRHTVPKYWVRISNAFLKRIIEFLATYIPNVIFSIEFHMRKVRNER